jgi:hypothetical protein
LSVDPVVDSSQQPYIYANDDAVNSIDPTGLCAEVSGVPSCQAHIWTNSWGTEFHTQVYIDGRYRSLHWGLLFKNSNLDRRVALFPHYWINGIKALPPTPKLEPIGYTFHGHIETWRPFFEPWKKRHLKSRNIVTFEFSTVGIIGQEDIGPVSCRIP